MHGPGGATLAIVNHACIAQSSGYRQVRILTSSDLIGVSIYVVMNGSNCGKRSCVWMSLYLKETKRSAEVHVLHSHVKR